jgi:hypothetical protein
MRVAGREAVTKRGGRCGWQIGLGVGCGRDGKDTRVGGRWQVGRWQVGSLKIEAPKERKGELLGI